jgi:hypothetical protein
MSKEQFGRRVVTLVAVAALHAALLIMLLSRPSTPRPAETAGRSTVLFMIERPMAPPITAPPITAQMRSPITQRTRENLERMNVTDQTSPAPSIEASPSAPEVDWNVQASQAAAAVIDRAIRQETRECDPSNTPNSFLPPCKKREHKLEWAEPRVGFSGGLPYVRIGEKCVIGLGFMGCAFGATPPANGALFEAMRDPERDRSSVPSPHPDPARR